ncbi:MAG: DUF1553 domain-containing protein [Verrucomicrobiota bacterium]
MDPDNTLLWRYPIHRLDAEAIRDAMLAVGPPPSKASANSRRPCGRFVAHHAVNVAVSWAFRASNSPSRRVQSSRTPAGWASTTRSLGFTHRSMWNAG